MTIYELFDKTIENNASDLHLLAGFPPVLRIDGALMLISTFPPLTSPDIENLTRVILNEKQKEKLTREKSIDFSLSYIKNNIQFRFRINLYFQKGTLAGAFRLLPATIKTIEELNLPKILHRFAYLAQGLILVTGPTGHGKSTTLASIINEINLTRAANIITIEDPIEYIYPRGKSLVSQREIGSDASSWQEALRSVLREDPDVVLIGEMRDPESIASAITIAETGHLVFSTLHTNSAAQSIDRIVDAFPEYQQNQIRIQLAGSLEGIVSERLLPRLGGGRIPACEVLIATNSVRANIRDAKTHLIDSIIQTSAEEGMIALENSLADLVRGGQIPRDIAQRYSLRPELLSKLLGE